MAKFGRQIFELDEDLYCISFLSYSSNFFFFTFWESLWNFIFLFNSLFALENIFTCIFRYQQLMKIGARRRILLTGTPLQNNLLGKLENDVIVDLYTIAVFLALS